MLQGNFFFLLNNWNTMMKQRIIIGFLCICLAKLLQKSEMRKDIVIELSYKGFG